MRTTLCLAALQAARRSAPFKTCRERLQSTGKTVEAALTATARKLPVALNALLASGTDYHAEPAT